MKIFNKTPPEPRNFYFMCVRCDNCGAEDEVEIPKGISFKTFVVGEACENCGLKKLQRRVSDFFDNF